jgi:hypothetical protein
MREDLPRQPKVQAVWKLLATFHGHDYQAYDGRWDIPRAFIHCEDMNGDRRWEKYGGTHTSRLGRRKIV